MIAGNGQEDFLMGMVKCLNPLHLFKGTHQDNVDDQKSKNRQCHGERNGRAKLTEEDVIEIRKLYVRGSSRFGQVALSRRFGVDQVSIGKIVNYKAWKLVVCPNRGSNRKG